jgi:transposase-like protein
MKKIRKSYPESLKAKVALEAYKGEKTAGELASLYGVHPTVISQWKKQLLTHAPELFARGKSNQQPEEDNDVLYAEIGRLKLENDFLKKKL